MNGRKWIPAEDARLNELMAQKMSYPRMAKELGRSVEAIRGRVNLLRFKAAVPHPKFVSRALGPIPDYVLEDQQRLLSYEHPTITAAFFNDPPPWRSALVRR